MSQPSPDIDDLLYELTARLLSLELAWEYLERLDDRNRDTIAGYLKSTEADDARVRVGVSSIHGVHAWTQLADWLAGNIYWAGKAQK